MSPKREFTIGNLLSIVTTLISGASILVAVALAYGQLVGADKMHDRRLDVVEAQMQASQAISRTDNADIVKRLSAMEGDIRVMTQILKSFEVGGARSPR